MATDAEKLTIRSNRPTVRTAVNSCISQVMKENPNMARDQAVAICESMAQRATGN